MWTQRCKVLMAAVGLLAILTPWALANQRSGAVIGNATYTHGPQLANALNHAADDDVGLLEHLAEPFVHGGPLSSPGVYFMVQTTPETSSEGPSAAELLFWESVKDSQDAADLQAYLDRYPEGIYAVLARNRLRRLTASGEPNAPQVPPSPPSPELVEAGMELSRADRRLIQLGLTAEGFDAGPADGLFGRTTRGAIARWQASRGEEATGYLDVESARLLMASGGQWQEQGTGHEAGAEAERERRDQEARELAQREAEAAQRPIGPNWIVAENQPCQLYNPNPEEGETVTWSGDCVEGKASGEGRWVWQSSHGTQVYEGRMHDGKMHSQGIMTASNGFRYEGEWREGKQHGRGAMTYADGDRYEGEWRGGKRHGRGVLTVNGEDFDYSYEGEWRGDKKYGQGILTVPEFYRYEGEWRNNKRNSQGILIYFEEGSELFRYEGEWYDGGFHGQGTLIYSAAGSERWRYEGEWRDDHTEELDATLAAFDNWKSMP